MEAAILILVLLFVAFVALGVYVGVKVIGAAKRGVDRTISQARRTVEDSTLRARSIGQPGVPGELAQLRLGLRSSMRATQAALYAGAAEDASLSESLGLFQRLSVHGRELDAELRQLERDPDRVRVAERLPALRENTRRITHSADALRWAARDRARKFAEDDLSRLSAQIDVESGALRHWSTEERPASGVTEARAAAGPAARQPVWPEPEHDSSDPTLFDQAWPEPPVEPQEIDAPDPRPRTGYPWRKSSRHPRPETTT
jgi:hypothetical protein